MARSSFSPPIQSDLGQNWRALRLVRGRVLFTELAFWMVLFGYDTRKRKFDNPTYAVYAVVFFAFWIFMVLLLMADVGAGLLLVLPTGPSVSATAAGSLGLAAFFLVSLFQAARRSPFSFSEQDAQILVTTPLDRRLVALVWFGEGWIPQGAVVGAVGTVLGYALLQATAPRELTASDLPVFLLAGMRMFSIAVPVSLGLLGTAWAAGASRLRGQYEQANQRWLAPVLALLLLAGLLLIGYDSMQIVLAPLVFPVSSGLGLQPWPAGMLIALALAVLGPLVLWFSSTGMSLARAAQETLNRAALKAAVFLGKTSLVDDLQMRQRLGASRAPSRLPAWPGAAALVWKNSIQAARRFSLVDFLAWFGILSTNLVLIAFPGWETRAWAVLGWTLLIFRLIHIPIQSNLSRWWLLHLQPFRSDTLIASMLILPVIGVWLAGIISGLAAVALGWQIPLPAAWLYLVSAPGIALAGTLDVLRQARPGVLLSGTVPGTTLVGLLVGLLVLLLNGGSLWLFQMILPFQPGLAFLLSISIGLGALYALWRETGRQLRNIH